MKKELTYQHDAEGNGVCSDCPCDAECYTNDQWLCPDCAIERYNSELWHYLENLGATESEFEDSNIDILKEHNELSGFEIRILIDSIGYEIKLPIDQLIKGWWIK